MSPDIKEDFATLCFGLGVSAVLLVVGAWLARDCYLTLRGKSFGAIKSIAGLLAVVFLGSVESWLIDLGVPFAAETKVVGDLVLFAAALPALLCAVLVYSVCVKLLNRLLRAAYSPEELSGTRHPAGD